MSFTDLKGVNSLGELSLNEIIEENLISFFDWGFINKGAYFNIQLNSSGAYGGSFAQLRPVQDPRYTNGQVWESYRKEWVWQSGLSVSPQPIKVSGVYVGSTFYSTSGVLNAHHVNYPLGRVIFSSGVSTTSTVKCEFSPKYIQITNLRNIPLFRHIQNRSFRVDDSTFLQSGSGNWNILGDSRTQLPLVGLERGGVSYVGHEIGGTTKQYNNFVFHVFSEDDQVGNRLTNYISQQKEKTIWMYDINMMYNSGQAILDYRGTIVNGTKTYPQLVEESGNGGFRFNRLYFYDAEAEGGDWISTNLYHSTVRITTEVIGKSL